MPVYQVNAYHSIEELIYGENPTYHGEVYSERQLVALVRKLYGQKEMRWGKVNHRTYIQIGNMYITYGDSHVR